MIWRIEMHLSTVDGDCAAGRSMDKLLVTEGRGILLPSDPAGCASSRRDEVAEEPSPGEGNLKGIDAGGGWNEWR